MTSAYTLCRVSRYEAEHLMLGPAVAGGWIAVHPDCRAAVSDAFVGRDIFGLAWADCLALLPSDWVGGAVGRPVRITPEDAARILAELERAARWPVAGDEVDSTPPDVIAERVRAYLADSVRS